MKLISRIQFQNPEVVADRGPRRRAPGVGVPATLVLLCIGTALAVAFGASDLQAQESPEQGRIVGTVLDAETGAPVAAALVRLREMGRSDLSHADGSFHIERVAAGEHRLVVERIGYATLEQEVSVVDGQVVEVTLRLRASAISLSGVVVTGIGRERGIQETYQPTSVLRGEELNRRLDWSLAGTIAHEPGISMKSFGPAPAQPVIRGLGGDRVLVLEDGNRTGDMSTTGPDHAVGIDPVTAQRIEIVRGPAGLLYGSNALGGVVNVIREEVPRSLPERLGGLISLQGASVNRGVTAAGRFALPIRGRFVLRGDLSGKTGGDIRTPLGPLPTTDSRGYNGSIGASWLPGWGFLGLAYREYLLDHGVPGEFDGELIPGAHAGGADLETRRRVGRLQLGHFAGIGPFSSVEADANVVHYTHEEIEGVLASGQRVVGTSFDQVTATFDLAARHEHGDDGLRREGAVGMFALYRDLITGGSYSGTRDARETNLAVFAYEELGRGPFRFQIGARIDWLRTEPIDTRPIDSGEGEPVPVRTRTFTDASGSAAVLWELEEGWRIGASVARAVRPPSVPELFSNGPHLADFSYDIGSPELGTEVGLGADLFVRLDRPGLSLEAALFRNHISDFIHYRPTGEIDSRFFRFPVFRSTGEDAVFIGADGRAQWEFRRGLVLDGSIGYVRASYQDRDEPLPAIPPLNGGVRLRWEAEGDYYLTGGFDAAASQHRVPRAVPSPGEGEPDIVVEHPTDGYGVVHLGGGYRWTGLDRAHSITLTVDNALDTEWKDHLSRAKEVAPQPGRNIQLLYRVTL